MLSSVGLHQHLQFGPFSLPGPREDKKDWLRSDLLRTADVMQYI